MNHTSHRALLITSWWSRGRYLPKAFKLTLNSYSLCQNETIKWPLPSFPPLGSGITCILFMDVILTKDKIFPVKIFCDDLGFYPHSCFFFFQLLSKLCRIEWATLLSPFYCFNCGMIWGWNNLRKLFLFLSQIFWNSNVNKGFYLYTKITSKEQRTL